MRALPLLLLLAACSETGLSVSEDPIAPTEPEPQGPPEVAVDPLIVDLGVVCAEARADVQVRNLGGSPLTLSAVEIGGGGWQAQPPALPATIAPGTSTTIVLYGGEGPGSLRIVTDDPTRPTIDVPLDARPNTPPQITLEPPARGWTLPSTGTTPLIAQVVDPDEPDEGLTVAWASSVDGALATSPIAPDGTATYDWVAADRTEGRHELSATVADSCEARATATASACQNRGYLTDELDLRSWNFEGSARWDDAREAILLTPPLLSQAGTAFQIAETVDSSNVDIRFKFYMGGGTGADGLSLTVLDVARMTTFVGLFGRGIGYAGLPGFTVEVDTHYNSDVDPTSEHHVSFHIDGDQGRVLAWAALPKMDDSRWHDMRVSVEGRRVTVTIDDTTHIDQEFADLEPFEGYIGFTAATGALTNDHLIGELRVERFVCDDP